MITQTVVLFTQDFSVPEVVYAVEDDTARRLVAAVADFSLTSGMTAELWVLKSDGTRASVAGTINTEDQTITVDMDDAITEDGRNFCQIKLTDGSETVSTFSFVITVQEGV